MKKGFARKVLLFLMLFVILSGTVISVLMFLMPSVNASGITLDYTFENDILVNTTEYDTSFNMRNQSEYSGNYPGTYSFENETGLENLDIPFISEFGGAGSDALVQVSSSLFGHDSILNLSVSDGVKNAYFYSDFESGVLSGVIEWWQYKSGSTGYLRMFADGPTEMLRQ